MADPHGVEGVAGVTAGLGLLAMDTEMTRDKRLAQVSGRCAFADATCHRDKPELLPDGDRQEVACWKPLHG